jgi:hypothetical protein
MVNSKSHLDQNLTQNSQLVERFQDTACSRDQKGIGDKHDGPLPPFIHGAGSEALALSWHFHVHIILLVRNCRERYDKAYTAISQVSLLSRK